MMVKPGPGLETLLRRPFSVFEILLKSAGVPVGVTLLNKPIGTGTGGSTRSRPAPGLGARAARTAVHPDGGWRASLAGRGRRRPGAFATMAEALVARGIDTTLFYGARRAADLYYADWFRERGVKWSPRPRMAAKATAVHHRAARARVRQRTAGQAVSLYACGPTPMMRAVRTSRSARRRRRSLARTDHGLRPRRLLQLRRPHPRGRPHAALRAVVHRWPCVPRQPDRLGGVGPLTTKTVNPSRGRDSAGNRRPGRSIR